MTVEEAVRKEFRAELGEDEIPKQHVKKSDGLCARSCQACAKSSLLQKYGIVAAVINKNLNNPGWIPEERSAFNDREEIPWNRVKSNWNNIINQYKKDLKRLDFLREIQDKPQSQQKRQDQRQSPGRNPRPFRGISTKTSR